jgi:arylsulfatase A-like enzyme
MPISEGSAGANRISRRSFGLSLCGAPGLLAAPPRPNMVVFLVDDLGWRDLGCYGSTFYETPNLDRLAASGMRFTSSYAACPVCSPTRASIMTGKYPVRTGITDFIAGARTNQPEKWSRNTRLLPAPYTDRLALSETTVAEVMKAAGYATFFAGKWHLGPEGFWPEKQGFDINKGGCDFGGPYGGKKYFSPYGNPRLEDGPPGEHLPDRLARETVAFIESHREQPFFAYFSFYSVHLPLMARPDLEAKYQKKAARLTPAEPRFLPERKSQIRQVQDHPVYAAMVEAMDLAAGKVLDAIQRLGLSERTVVLFTSDNGGESSAGGAPTSNVPLRAGKGWLYEGGVRTPLIVRAPGVTRAGTVCDGPVTSTDLFPTILDLAGLPLQPRLHLDGASIRPLLRGDRRSREPLFWHYPHYGNQGGAPGGAIRKGEWKLIEWYEDGQLELFNLASDPGEKQNLAGKFPARVRELHTLLRDWRRANGAVMPSPNPRYREDG